MTDLDDRPAEPDLPEPYLEIDPYEKNWMRVSIVLLVAFAAAITVAGFAAGFQLPGPESRVDPRTLLDTEPWKTPGVFEVAEGEYEAYVVAQAWSFSPLEIVVPVGADVTIYVTSSDLQHGFKITDTNINMMVLPGQVSKLEYTFDEVGEFPYLCTEYCGQGHAAMYGRVTVLSQADYDARTADTEATDASGSEG
ncbi:MAG: cytochrome c oxidase subunit II [Ilumatobacteraceae bacterium]|nr:cytochrome c oxidase subunit II [Acidimicrobiales bacterium]MCB9394831.1 cytochrome C oxidase subunit II [Acidimicrobiaceae bacterium]